MIEPGADGIILLKGGAIMARTSIAVLVSKPKEEEPKESEPIVIPES